MSRFGCDTFRLVINFIDDHGSLAMLLLHFWKL
jgi:hypothetical protein